MTAGLAQVGTDELDEGAEALTPTRVALDAVQEFRSANQNGDREEGFFLLAPFDVLAAA